MRLKYLGVLIPGIVIVLVIIVGLFDMGFSEETSVTEYLNYGQLFPYEEGTDCMSKVEDESAELLLLTKEYKNSFFLSKYKKEPSFVICPIGLGGDSGKRWNFMAVIYANGIEKGHNTYNYNEALPGQRNSVLGGGEIELPAGSTTTFELKITPICPYKQVKNESSSSYRDKFYYEAYEPTNAEGIWLFDANEFVKSEGAGPIIGLSASSRRNILSCNELIADYSDKAIKMEIRKE